MPILHKDGLWEDAGVLSQRKKIRTKDKEVASRMTPCVAELGKISLGATHRTSSRLPPLCRLLAHASLSLTPQFFMFTRPTFPSSVQPVCL